MWIDPVVLSFSLGFNALYWKNVTGVLLSFGLLFLNGDFDKAGVFLSHQCQTKART